MREATITTRTAGKTRPILPRAWLVPCLLAVVGCQAGPKEMAAKWPPGFELDSSWTDASENPLTSPLVASNRRDWCQEQAVLATAEFRGDQVTIRRVRDFRHYADGSRTPGYYDKTFDLNRIRSVDFFVVPFPESPNLAHTMLSFGFDGGDYVALSVEVRKEKGETYDPIKGMLNQYELMYVLADERDVIQLRTHQWHNDVHLYPTRATPAQARALFVDVLNRANRLAQQPEFYNTLTNNCTSNIVAHVNRLAPNKVPLDYRVLVAGKADELAYDLGLLDADSTLDQVRQEARINASAYLYDDRPDFSTCIRQRPGASSPFAVRK